MFLSSINATVLKILFLFYLLQEHSVKFLSLAGSLKNYFKTSAITLPVVPLGNSIPNKAEMVGAISGISVSS